MWGWEAGERCPLPGWDARPSVHPPPAVGVACGAVMGPWCWVGPGLALPTCATLSVTAPRSGVLCEPFQTIPVSSTGMEVLQG